MSYLMKTLYFKRSIKKTERKIILKNLKDLLFVKINW